MAAIIGFSYAELVAVFLSLVLITSTHGKRSGWGRRCRRLADRHRQSAGGSRSLEATRDKWRSGEGHESANGSLMALLDLQALCDARRNTKKGE